MRQRLCVFVLLLGFAGPGHVQAGGGPNPIPIERPLRVALGGRLERTMAWWQAA